MALTDTNSPPVLPNSDEESQEQSAENSAKVNNDRQLQEYREKQKVKVYEEQVKSQLALLKKLYDEYLEIFIAFYRFNFQWPDKVENFPAYEARFVNSKITDLRNVCDQLKDKINKLEKIVITINTNQNEKYKDLLKYFTDCRNNLITLVEQISGYEAVQGDNNYEHRFHVYKPVAETVQHLQYSLQFSLNTALDEFINTGRLKPFKQQTTLQAIKLPGDLLRKISNSYLSIKDTVHLSEVAHAFFGISSFQIYMEAKRRKLRKFKYFGCVAGMYNIYIWGDSKIYVKSAKFDFRDKSDGNIPTEVDLMGSVLLGTDKIKQVFLETSHSILLTEERRCFVWGLNNHGQLGLGDNNDRNIRTELDLSRLSLSATDKIKQIIVSDRYNIMLTKENRCFVWGLNDHGQLGLGDNVDRNIPTELNLSRLNLSATDKIKQVIVGNRHNIMLTDEGRCFVWGANVFGQLGLGDNADRNIPVELNIKGLNLSATDKIKQVVAGVVHNILITEEGRCFVWGVNGVGQLGLGINTNRNIPTELDIKSLNLSVTDRIKLVVAGYHHTILLTEEGRCFVWGLNDRCQLGLGDNNHRVIPTELNIKRLNLSMTDSIKQVVAGAMNSILITEEGRYFEWGYDFNDDVISSNGTYIKIPTEVSHPYCNEKNKFLKSIIDDISQLAIFAFDNTDYGIDFKRMLLAKNNVLSCSWLHPLVIDVFKNRQFNENFYSLMNALIKLGDFYHYFASNKPSTDQGIRLIDFVALLKILSSGEINNKEKLADHINETAKIKHFKNRVELQFFGTSIAIPHISKRYYELGQSLLAQLNNNQIKMVELKLAAEIFLQGLNNAEPKNGMAYTLKSLIDSNHTNYRPQ